MGARFGPPDELHPFLDQGLTRPVRRMRLAGDDELHRALRIGEQAQQSLRIVQQQIGSLVGGEAARKTQRQGVGIEQLFRLVDRLGRRARRRPAAGTGARARSRPATSLAAVRSSRASRRGCGGCPAPESPSSPASGPCRRPPSRGRRPAAESQVGMWTPLVTCPTGTSLFGPAREERREDPPADLAVQATDAVDRAAAADRQVGHVERLRRVVWILAAQSQQIVERNAELLPRRSRRDTAR